MRTFLAYRFTCALLQCNARIVNSLPFWTPTSDEGVEIRNVMSLWLYCHHEVSLPFAAWKRVWERKEKTGPSAAGRERPKKSERLKSIQRHTKNDIPAQSRIPALVTWAAAEV